ncbi:sialidase family protein [Alteromonadaceae bacterium BrNp21-10]|nr:sialidase family protein [Alteromonadaceae bacterium BrNp21-10]
MKTNIFKRTLVAGATLSAISLLSACGSSGGATPVVEQPTPPNTLTVQQQCEIDTFDNAPTHPSKSISWDQDSIQFISSGVYSRVKKLADGQLIIVYSDGPAVVYQLSDDDGTTWGEQFTVASGGDKYGYTNAEFIELNDGTWIYAWNARPTQEHGAETFQIKTSISYDKGQTWQPEELIFSAANTFDQGVWEPVFLQLPSGELQLYFANEFPYGGSSHDQEISMQRSFDNGISWGDVETISYRPNSRDGMPVPIVLNDQSEIVFSIEDNGIAGEFKPVTIRTSLDDNWLTGVINAESEHRQHALHVDAQLDNGIYAGAPYIAQFPSGETILSVQSAQCRKGTLAYLRVYLGDEQARNFAYPTTPFSTDFVKEDGEVLWSGLTVLDDETIIATSSINTGDNTNPNGVYIVKGKIQR